MGRKRVIVGMLVFLVGLGGSVKVVSAETAEHGGDHHVGGHVEAEEALVPGTLQGVWHEVMKGQEHLEELIASGQLADVHKQAFHIRDLVQTLPEISGELSVDKQQRLQQSVSRVGEIAKLLDQYGDSGDAENTKMQSDRLAKLLKYIETLYPEDALHSARTEVHGGKEMQSDVNEEDESGHAGGGDHHR